MSKVIVRKTSRALEQEIKDLVEKDRTESKNEGED